MNILNLCNDIKKYFSDKKINFGENLFNEVKNQTINFTENLTFFNLKNKIDDEYLDYMLHFYCQQNKNLFFIIVWPVTYNFDKIIKECYKKYGSIIFKKEIKLNDNGITNMLKLISNKSTHPKGKELWFAEPHRSINPLTIYLFETKKINVKENEMFNYLVKIFNNNKDHISNIQKLEGLNNLYCTTKAKRECRELLKKNNCVSDISSAPDKNYSHHVNDEHWETIEMSRVFFNNNSIYAINNFNSSYKSESFINKYKKYFNFINKKYDINDFCINNLSINIFKKQKYSDNLNYFSTNKNIFIQDNIINQNNILENSNLKLTELIYNPKNYFWFEKVKILTLNNLLKLKVYERNIILEKNNYKIENIVNNEVSIITSEISDFMVNNLIKHFNYNNLKLIRLVHTTCHFRKVWKDDKYYYKIINFNDIIDKSFLNLNYTFFFKKAIKNNFYKNITYNVEFIETKEENVYLYKMPILNNISKLDKKKYEDLENLLVTKFKDTGIIYTDLNIENIKEINNIYYLIDLETVTDFNNYTNWNIKNPRFVFIKNKSYDKKINDIINNK
jgi:hypothetical protein